MWSGTVSRTARALLAACRRAQDDRDGRRDLDGPRGCAAWIPRGRRPSLRWRSTGMVNPDQRTRQPGSGRGPGGAVRSCRVEGRTATRKGRVEDVGSHRDRVAHPERRRNTRPGSRSRLSGRRWIYALFVGPERGRDGWVRGRKLWDGATVGGIQDHAGGVAVQLPRPLPERGREDDAAIRHGQRPHGTLRHWRAPSEVESERGRRPDRTGLRRHAKHGQVGGRSHPETALLARGAPPIQRGTTETRARGRSVVGASEKHFRDTRAGHCRWSCAAITLAS